MEQIVEIIKKRYSARTYSSERIEESKKQAVAEYIASNRKGPFGNEVRFGIVDASEDDIRELKKLGTYGNTSGARLYIAGTVKKGDRDMEDFGYCMEKNILKATELGLGTVWLGGSLNRSAFAGRMGISPDEIIPAVTPIGYAADKRSVMDRVVAFVANARNRKSFGQLFFLGDFGNALQPGNCGVYATVLESVRLAPSASNKQPWRILKEKDGNIFHIYFKESSLYNNIIKGIKIQNIDMGIAMSHFELSARELGLEGSWETNKPAVASNDLQYIVSWIGK